MNIRLSKDKTLILFGSPLIKIWKEIEPGGPSGMMIWPKPKTMLGRWLCIKLLKYPKHWLNLSIIKRGN